jgi:hypothetical protein
MGGVLCLVKWCFFKVLFIPKVEGFIAMNSNPLRISKLVDCLISYVPGKWTTVIVVNWAKIGRSMTARKFCVLSSLFRSLWTMWTKMWPAGARGDKIGIMIDIDKVYQNLITWVQGGHNWDYVWSNWPTCDQLGPGQTYLGSWLWLNK